jgi:hypothetical protein
MTMAGQSGRTVGHADEQLGAKSGEGEELIGHTPGSAATRENDPR